MIVIPYQLWNIKRVRGFGGKRRQYKLLFELPFTTLVAIFLVVISFVVIFLVVMFFLAVISDTF